MLRTTVETKTMPLKLISMAECTSAIFAVCLAMKILQSCTKPSMWKSISIICLKPHNIWYMCLKIWWIIELNIINVLVQNWCLTIGSSDLKIPIFEMFLNYFGHVPPLTKNLQWAINQIQWTNARLREMKSFLTMKNCHCLHLERI